MKYFIIKALLLKVTMISFSNPILGFPVMHLFVCFTISCKWWKWFEPWWALTESIELVVLDWDHFPSLGWPGQLGIPATLDSLVKMVSLWVQKAGHLQYWDSRVNVTSFARAKFNRQGDFIQDSCHRGESTPHSGQTRGELLGAGWAGGKCWRPLRRGWSRDGANAVVPESGECPPSELAHLCLLMCTCPS